MACLAAVSAFAQGTVLFNNRITGTLDAPVRNVDGTLLGAGYFAQLWGGASAGSLTAITPVAQFITNPTTQAATGYFAGGERTITGIAAGGAAVIQVRAWYGGPTGAIQDWATALSSGVAYGSSATVNLASTGNPATSPPGTPVNMIGLTGFSLVPEPGTYALLALGAGALFLRRRK